MTTRVFRLCVGAGLAALAMTVYVASSGRSALTTLEARSLSGMATLSGTVESAKPFKAAQVFLRNADKRMLYMVYTSAGHYQAVNLFPGTYELTVKTKGLESSPQTIVVTAGQDAHANVTLREASGDAGRRADVAYLGFNEIYPAGPGLEVARRTCIYCHGNNFLPSRHWGAEQWNTAIDFMTGKSPQGAMIPPKDLSPRDRDVLVQYLVKNFGPDSKTRMVRVDNTMPFDEQALGKVQYIEYYLPSDAPGEGTNAPEYRAGGGFGRGRRGQDVRFDRDGNVWVTDRGVPNRLVKLDPRTGEYKDYLLPRPTAGIHDLIIDNDGMIWLPEYEGIPEGAVNLNMFNPKTEKWEGRYPLDPDDVVKGLIHAQSLALDSKGNVYVGFIVGNALARFDRATKKSTVFPLPTPDAFPYGVVADKDDNIWVAEFHASKIAKFDTRTNKWTEYPAIEEPVLIRRLNVDSKGDVWYGVFSGGRLGKVDHVTGTVTEYKIPHEFSQPYSEVEYEGNIWFSDAGQGGALIKFNPTTEAFTYYPTPQSADQPKIQMTREGAIWYAPRSSQQYPGIGVMYPDKDTITTLAAHY